jgi:hypothetical protein
MELSSVSFSTERKSADSLRSRGDFRMELFAFPVIAL